MKHYFFLANAFADRRHKGTLGFENTKKTHTEILGWVDFDLGLSIILSTCSATSPDVPSAQAELTECGTAQIKVNPTQVRQEMGHPVLLLCMSMNE